MEHTIIAAFDSLTLAQKARDRLLGSGLFDAARIRITPEAEGQAARTQSLAEPAQEVPAESEHHFSLRHFFRSLFGAGDEDEAQRGPWHSDVYSEAVRRGHFLLTLEVADDAAQERAYDLLAQCNATDIHERAEAWRAEGWAGYDPSAAPYDQAQIKNEMGRYASASPSAPQTAAGSARATTAGASTASKSRSSGRSKGAGAPSGGRIPVVEEQLRVGTRPVDRGGVRIFQRVTERPVEETVRLRDEFVQVERQSVDRPATADDLAPLSGGSVEIRTRGQEPVVGKEARVVEEVVVAKGVREREAQVRDTVRRTDVEVQDLGQGAAGNATPSGSALTENPAWRSHWQSAYASQGGRYEDYLPAYRYGSSLSDDARYRGQQWNDIEPRIRTEWESRSGSSAWDKTRDAIRHGWEQVKR